jgi:tRNA-dihydrouridine synthase
MLVEQEHPKHALHKLRTFTGWYTHGLPGGRQLRLRIGSLGTAAEFREAVELFFEDAAAHVAA